MGNQLHHVVRRGYALPLSDSRLSRMRAKTKKGRRTYWLKGWTRLQWLCGIALIGCALQASLHAKTNEHKTVVVISLDGFPAYALDDPRLPIPTLRKLAREGVAAASMRPVNPTVTWPNHTAIVTGVEPSEHQVLYPRHP